LIHGAPIDTPISRECMIHLQDASSEFEGTFINAFALHLFFILRSNLEPRTFLYTP
jgi:hypothetical protein